MARKSISTVIGPLLDVRRNWCPRTLGRLRRCLDRNGFGVEAATIQIAMQEDDPRAPKFLEPAREVVRLLIEEFEEEQTAKAA